MAPMHLLNIHNSSNNINYSCNLRNNKMQLITLELSFSNNDFPSIVLTVKVTDSYFYQTNTALYPVKSENSLTTADDR